MSKALQSKLNNLTEQDKAEVAHFVQSEQQNAEFRMTVHSLTEMCWDRCGIQSSSKSEPLLSDNETKCLRNCVKNFLQTSKFVVERFRSGQASA